VLADTLRPLQGKSRAIAPRNAAVPVGLGGPRPMHLLRGALDARGVPLGYS